MPFGEKISSEVSYIDMCVRYGNTGKTFIIRTFDKNNPADLAAINAHNSLTTQLSFTFYDNVIGIALSDYEANTAFDDVPEQAQTLELFKNRVGLGNIRIGKDTPATTSLTIANLVTGTENIRIFKTGSSYKLSIEFLDRYRRKCGAVRTDLSVTIPERTRSQSTYIYQLHWTLSNTNALAEIPDWAYFYQILLTKNQTKQSFVETQTAQVSYVRKNTDGTYDYTGTDYNAAEIYALAVDISNLYLFGQGYTYNAGDMAILYGATQNYHAKVLGQDGSNVLLTPVNLGSTTNSYTGDIPSQVLEEFESSGSATNTLTMSLATSSNTVPAIVFNNTTAAPLDVDNARSSSNNNISITDGNAYNISIADTVILAPRGNSINNLFNVSIKAVITHPTLDNISYTLYEKLGGVGLETINADIHTTVSVPAGYTKLFIYTDYFSDVTGTIHSGSRLTFSTTGVSTAQIEIYTPYKASPQESFYEVPSIYAVSNPGTNTRTYGTLSGFIDGDIALKARIIQPSTIFVVEVMSLNDDTWADWELDLGWPNFVTDLGQQRKPTTMVWSDTYINGTKNNALNKFNPLNSKDIGNTSGAIQKLQLTNKQQEDGNVLLILTEQVALSAYLHEVQTYKAAGADALITTDEVMGTINELKNAYGTINPESVVLYNGDVWWIDVINGLICQYGDNGVYPVSDFKMRSFFLHYCRRYMAHGYTSANNPIHAGYDSGADELLFALPQVEIDAFAPLLPSYSNTIPDYASDISNRFNLYDGQAKCMVYKPKTNRWTSVYRWLPDCMEYVGQRFFGWSNGMLYAFNEGTGFNTIFGITYPQRICAPINIGDASAVKQVMRIALEGNGIKPDFTVLYSNYPVEQLTDLAGDDVDAEGKPLWTNEEGVLYASFLRDRLSFTDPIQGLLEGDIITSQTPMLLLEFNVFSNPLIINFINIYVLLSKGQNTLLTK
jgi:hypothetical protein